jgi:hypothetical protein
MARPETIKDVKERMVEIGTIDLERIVTNPALLKPYTAFIEAVQKMNGTVETTYGSQVKMKLLRDQKQLEHQLSSEQYLWDDIQKRYNQAVRADESNPVPEYFRNSVTEWAKAEGLPDPFDPFAANDPELRRIREELGFNDE